jgi:hypothetical protein
MKKKLLIAAGIIAVLGLGAWWRFYQPYTPEALYDVVPARATMITEHLHLAERVDAMVQHPLAEIALAATGADPAEVLEGLTDPDVEGLLQKFTGERSLLFMLDEGQASSGPVFGFATWAGSQSALIEMLGPHLGTGIEKVDKLHGVKIYRVTGALEAPWELSICVVGGMVVGCISSDPQDLGECVEAAVGHTDSLSRDPDHPFFAAKLWAGEAPDFGLFTVPLNGVPTPIFLRVDRWTKHECAGQAQAAWLQPGGKPVDTAVLSDFGALLGEAPKTIIVSEQSAYFRQMLQGQDYGPWAEFVGAALDLEGSQGSALSLVGGKLSGRVAGIKIPALLGVVKVSDPVAAIAELQKEVKALSLAYEFDLDDDHEAVHGGEIFDPTSWLSYARLGPWILVGSSPDSIRKVIERRKPGQFPPWATGYRRESYLHMDAGETSDIIGKALAAYILKMLLLDADSEDEVADMQHYQELSDLMIPLEKVAASLSVAEGLTTLDFEIGRPPQ